MIGDDVTGGNNQPNEFVDETRSEGAAADTAAAGDAEAGGHTAQPDAEIARLQQELQQANDRVLRAQAEVENVRRRLRREMDDQRKYACQSLMYDLLPVLDNMQRAIEAAEKNADGAGLLEGFKMVSDLLVGVLEKHHCKQIDAHGRPFDPQLHEAIAQHPSDEHEPGTIMLVHQHGYQLHDRVVRPSQVIVSAADDTAE